MLKTCLPSSHQKKKKKTNFIKDRSQTYEFQNPPIVLQPKTHKFQDPIPNGLMAWWEPNNQNMPYEIMGFGGKYS